MQGTTRDGARVQISRDGGTAPVWARNGTTLFYCDPAPAGAANLMEATLDLAGTPRVVSRQQVVANLSLALAVNHANFDISADGRHFIVVVPEPNQGIVVVTGWSALLRAQ